MSAAFDPATPFTVKFDCSHGAFTVECHPEWAPLGAERFHEMVSEGVLDSCRFFRVIAGFMVQFGIAGDPSVSAVWRDRTITDDPNKQSNQAGYLSFAMAGPNTRTTQLFINFGDNSFLDSQGFSPFAKVVDGVDVVNAIHSDYGEGAPSGNGPDQQAVQMEGNAYLERDFPNLDYIKTATIVS